MAWVVAAAAAARCCFRSKAASLWGAAIEKDDIPSEPHFVRGIAVQLCYLGTAVRVRPPRLEQPRGQAEGACKVSEYLALFSDGLVPW
jgi:hypothetical protein